MNFILHVVGELQQKQCYAWRHDTQAEAEKAATELCDRNRTIEVLVAQVVSVVACKVSKEPVA